MTNYAEQAVLGAALLSSNAFEVATEHLDGGEFTTDESRAMWAALQELRRDGIDTDAVTVGEHRPELATLAVELARNVPSAANVGSYAKMVRDAATVRALRQIGAELATWEGKGTDGLEHAQTLINNLAMRGQSGGLLRVAEFLRKQMGLMEDAMDADGQLLGYPWALTDLNTMTSGLQPGKLVIVGGRPGMGKSALAQNAAEATAFYDTDKAVAVFQLEMPGAEMAGRSMASIARVDYNSITHPAQLETNGGWPKLTEAMKKLAATNFYICDQPALTAEQIRIRARQLHSKYPLSLVVVDYVQLIRLPGKQGRNDELAEVTASLKRLAKELDCCVVCLSQLNRDCERRSNKRPVLADLRDSGGIEADADVVIFVYRDEVYFPQSKDQGIAEIIVAKNRSGSVGTVRASASLCFMRFDDLARRMVA